MEEIASSAAMKALRARETAQGALLLANRGCSQGDEAALEQARARGWHPSMGGEEYFGQAMREPTGRAIAWLMEHFPMAAAISQTLSRPGAQGSSGWRLGAMLAAQPLGSASLLGWSQACAGSGADALAYFKASMRPGSPWAPWSGAAKDAGEAGSRLDVLESCMAVALRGPTDVARVAAEFAAPWAAQALALAGEPRAGAWLDSLASSVREKLVKGESLAPIAPLLDLLAREATHCSSQMLMVPANVKRMDKAGPAPWARQQDRQQFWKQALGEWTSHGRGLGAKAPRPLGLAALLGPSDENALMALSRGWIDPLPAQTMGSCEDPSFVAWDQKRVEKEKGMAIPMEKRWSQCREAIAASAADPALKAKLLAICDGAPPQPWTESSPKRVALPMRIEISPTEISLAMAARSNFTETRARALSSHGFLISQAQSKSSLLAEEIAAASKPQWLRRLQEEEQLRQVALAARSSSKPKAL